MPAVAEFAPGDHRHGSLAAGFHLVETYCGMPMRWSEPAALVSLVVTHASRRIVIECAPVRSPLANLDLKFFINEFKVPRDALAFADHRIVITIEPTTMGTIRLAWICPPFTAIADRRRLGLPVLRIAVEDR